MYAPITVIIADDHELFRDGFKLLLSTQNQLQLVAEAENGAELIKLVEKYEPEVVFSDIRMPVLDGIGAIKAIKKKHPEVGIIALSMFNEDHLIIDALESGANGYLLKNTNKNEFVKAALTIVKGGTFYCSSTSARLNKIIADRRFNPCQKIRKEKFTSREIQVIKLICEEYSNKEIASILQLSTRTVESYRETIQNKTGARNSIGIAIYAFKNRLYTFND